MRKCRLLTVIIVILLLMITLTGCVQKDVNVLLSHTAECVTIHTSKECVLDLTIKIKDGAKTDTFTKTFEFKGNETINLEINTFVSEYYDGNAIIIEASHGQPKYTETQVFGFALFGTIGALIAIYVSTGLVAVIIATIKEVKKAQHQN